MTLFALSSITASTVLAGSFTREIAELFPAEPGQMLEIEAGSGSIEVRPGDDDQVEVKILLSVKTGSEEKANDIFDATEIQMEQDEGKIVVDVKSNRKGGFLSWLSGKPAQVKIIASCPRKYDLVLDTGSGAINVEEISGEHSFDTGSGSIVAANLSGSLEADTGSGSISLDGMEGSVNADTGSGSISLRNLNGPFSADTGSGSVTVTTSADLITDSTASPGSGSIQVIVPETAALDIVASSGSGSITCELPNTSVDTESRNSLVASANGGGTQLSLKAGSGNIHLKSTQ